MPSIYLLCLPCAIFTSFATAQSPIRTMDGSYVFSEFGRVVRSAGDVDADGFADVIIGAPHHSIEGRVFVYSGATGSLLYSIGGVDELDLFGTAVSGAGDLNHDGHADFLVGAELDDHSPSNLGCQTGMIRVYSGLDGSVLFEDWGATCGEELGLSASTLGDLNGDGYEDFGAGTFPGILRVYSGQDGSVLYTYQAASWMERFGKALDGAGDVNADGHDDFIVGAEGADYAKVFSGADGSLLWTLTGGSKFGCSVSGAGDVNQDGYDDVIVGSYAENPDNSGVARVFSGADGSVLYVFQGETGSEHLGTSVAGGLDVSGDGVPDLVVGGPNYWKDGFSETLHGRIAVFSGADGALLWPSFGLQTYGNYGRSVDLVEDLDGDGLAEVLLGAPGEDAASVGGGRAHLISGGCQAPVRYCTAKVDSQGCLPEIGFTGSPSITGPDDFHVTATNLLSRRGVGVLMWSLFEDEVPGWGEEPGVWESPSRRGSCSPSATIRTIAPATSTTTSRRRTCPGTRSAPG